MPLKTLGPIGPRAVGERVNPLHCYKKFIHVLEITIGQDKIYGWSAQLVYSTISNI
jgi:hypothetical protein